MKTIYATVNMRSMFARLQILENNKKKTVVSAGFIYNGGEILIAQYDVYDEYKKQGYGTMLMYTLMGVARAKKIPIVVFAMEDSIEFYKKLGFYSLLKHKKGNYRGKTVTILNLNDNMDFECQVSKEDLIWIPLNVDDVIIEI